MTIAAEILSEYPKMSDAQREIARPAALALRRWSQEIAALAERHGKRPERLLLYWTSEARKRDALIEFPYRPELVDAAARVFDSVVGKIQAKEFQIVTVPEPGICKECDLRSCCTADGTIRTTAAGPRRRRVET